MCSMSAKRDSEKIDGFSKSRSRNWTEDEVDLYAAILVDNEYGFATTLENLAAKKSSNKEVFSQIKQILDLALNDKDFKERNGKTNFPAIGSAGLNYEPLDTSVEKLRKKYSNLKTEWRKRIDQTINGLNIDKEPRWCTILNKAFAGFTGANGNTHVNNVTSISSCNSYNSGKCGERDSDLTPIKKNELDEVQEVAGRKRKKHIMGKEAINLHKPRKPKMVSIFYNHREKEHYPVYKDTEIYGNEKYSNFLMNRPVAVARENEIHNFVDTQTKEGEFTTVTYTGEFPKSLLSDKCEKNQFYREHTNTENSSDEINASVVANETNEIEADTRQKIEDNSFTIITPKPYTKPKKFVKIYRSSHRQRKRFRNPTRLLGELTSNVKELVTSLQDMYKLSVQTELRRDQLFFQFCAEEAEKNRAHEIRLAEIYSSAISGSHGTIPLKATSHNVYATGSTNLRRRSMLFDQTRNQNVTTVCHSDTPVSSIAAFENNSNGCTNQENDMDT